MSVPFRRAAIAAACSFASAAAQAQAEAPQRELGTVTITGGQATSLPTQIPTTIEGVTAEQIGRSINATDSQDALKYLPSLLVRKRYIGDYNHAVLSTRASGTGNPARSMVYADGILLSNYLGNGPTNAPRWMLVAPEEIDRVDVLYGPFSAAYPGNSVGAVVDYVTRMPQTFEAHGKVSFQHQPYRLYATDESYSGHQIGASAGNKAGDWSWFFSLTHTRSEGQPLTFATRTLAQGTPGNAGTPVTGAVPDLDRTNQPWYLLGTGTQYTTTQNVFKLKLAYDISSTLKAQYTLGLWNNRADGQAATYLRDAAGKPVYSGTVNIAGRSFNLNGATPLFGQTREDITHVMHGFTLKTRTQGTWDWAASVSQYDYATDELRRNGTVLPGAFNGGAGTIVDGDGTGWTTLDLRGTWRPQGVGGPHIVDLGIQRDHYRLRTRDNATPNWITGAAGALTAAFGGDSTLTSLWAQDTWRLAPGWKAVLGGRLENWQTDQGYRSNGTASVAYPERAETYVSPKAALSWQAAPQWVLKASTGRAIRVAGQRCGHLAARRPLELHPGRPLQRRAVQHPGQQRHQRLCLHRRQPLLHHRCAGHVPALAQEHPGLRHRQPEQLSVLGIPPLPAAHLPPRIQDQPLRKPTMNIRHITLCAVLAVTGASAFAHVTLEQPQAAPGARYKAVLKVTHGCSGSPTLVVDVALPPGVRSARPMPKAGWKLEVLREPLAQPYQSHGRTITEDATRIRWTARTPDDALASAHYDEFVLVASLPEQPGTLYWPVTQLCERGRLDWTEVPGPGKPFDMLTAPAAVLEVK